MSYGKTGLTFKELSQANLSRVRRWHKTFPGTPTDGDWVGSDWSNATLGEAGEMADALIGLLIAMRVHASLGSAGNLVKKLRREEAGHAGRLDPSVQELINKLGDEMADVTIYLDLLAQYYGLSLDERVAKKFNEVSDREGFPEKLDV